MSVINQLLIDLEKRRASGAERGSLPSHVRALPQSEPGTNWGRVAAAGAAVTVLLAGLWALLLGFDWQRPVAEAPAAPRAADAAIEKVVAASAGVALTDRADGPQRETLASRMSFELSSLPAAAERGASPRAPIQTSRVVADADASTPAGRSEPVKAAAAKGAPGKTEIQKEVRQPTPRELAESEYRNAVASLQRGQLTESQEGFQAALNLYPGYHAARQALVSVLLEGKKLAEAERVLQDGVALAPAQTGFAMTLARLQVDRGDAALASATLRKGVEYAQGNPEYLAFLAALMQRQSRHDEAIEQFQAALRLRPGSGLWWLGLGVSLQAVNRTADAQEAFRRARAANNLSPELAAFAEQRLRQLQ